MGNDEFAADASAAAGQQMGKAVLLCDRAAQIVRRHQAQAKRGFAKPQAFDALVLQYPVYVTRVELAVLRQDAAEPAVLMRDDAARSFDRPDISLGFHPGSLS